MFSVCHAVRLDEYNDNDGMVGVPPFVILSYCFSWCREGKGCLVRRPPLIIIILYVVKSKSFASVFFALHLKRVPTYVYLKGVFITWW